MNIFIPIKHNSQRVHRKNFRRFGKEPLFKHTLLKYKKHNVYVDTDSQTVIDLIDQDKRLKHVTVFNRTESLRGDKVSVCDLLRDFIERFKISEPIAQIHVTSPFLRPQTLVNAYSFLEKHDSVASCSSYNSRFWRKENYGYCPVNHNPIKMEQTQDLPTLYEENSAFYIFKPEVIVGLNSRVGRSPYFYVIDKIESIDIDTEDDWSFAAIIKDVLK
jgi:CMP-N-acetylneuraminic acid synthetase